MLNRINPTQAKPPVSNCRIQAFFEAIEQSGQYEAVNLSVRVPFLRRSGSYESFAGFIANRLFGFYGGFVPFLKICHYVCFALLVSTIVVALW